MNRERYLEMDRCLDEVLKHPVARRQTVLDELCRHDLDLRREIEGLLDVEEAGCGFLEVPLVTVPVAAGAETEADPNVEIGLRIGPYQLLEVIGRGAAAVVYRVQRDGDPPERQFAAKLSRANLPAAEIRRWRLEWQILIQFDHPGIARCYDCRFTDDGRVLLIMELVDGMPLADWCDEHRVSVSGRLQLFYELCNAVFYAHRHGVIHRDVKPQNVLVSPNGQIKLTDFGIAKLLSPRLLTPEPEPSTASWLRLLTPGYTSPEQIAGTKITPATDVFCLGLVLFELLAGVGPHGIENTGMVKLEIMHAIWKQKPLTLAEALEKLANEPERAGKVCRNRGVSGLEELRGELGEPLERIVAQTLNKEPSQRYRTAAALADDVGRHLRGLPVRPSRRGLVQDLMKFGNVVGRLLRKTTSRNGKPPVETNGRLLPRSSGTTQVQG